MNEQATNLLFLLFLWSRFLAANLTELTLHNFPFILFKVHFQMNRVGEKPEHHGIFFLSRKINFNLVSNFHNIAPV